MSYSHKEKHQYDPRTYVNSQYKINITASNEEYTLENKIKQDTLPIIAKSNHIKKKLQQQKDFKTYSKEQLRSLKQSNQTYLLQLVSNQDLDQMKDLIHKSIQQRGKGMFTPGTEGNMYVNVKNHLS